MKLDLIEVLEGEFLRGADPSVDHGAESDETPQRNVWLSTFYMQRTVVTVEQWRQFLASSGYRWDELEWITSIRDEYAMTPTGAHPVTMVSWFDCIAFVDWLNRSADKSMRYSLPTEAQWEKCCRGSKSARYPWPLSSDTKEIELEKVRVGTIRRTIHPVSLDRSKVTAYGAHDMWCNVSEWCHDWYDGALDYNYYGSDDLVNPSGPITGEYKVVRGGDVLTSGWPRCSKRAYLAPSERATFVGFRIAAAASQSAH